MQKQDERLKLDLAWVSLIVNAARLVFELLKV